MPIDPNERVRAQDLADLRAHIKDASSFRGGYITNDDVEGAEDIFDINRADILAEVKALGIFHLKEPSPLPRQGTRREVLMEKL